MKNTIIKFAAIAMLFLAACKDKTKFVINGTFVNASKGAKVYLYGFQNNEMKAVDSTFLSDKGDFKFERIAADPSLFRIVLESKYYMVAAANGDEIDFKADFTNQHANYTLEGTEDAKDLTALNTLKNEYAEKITVMQQQFETMVEKAPEKRDQFVQQITPAYNATLGEMNQALLKFANEHANSIVSFYAVSMVNPENNEPALIAYADKIRGKFASNSLVKAFTDQMAGLKRVQVGQIAPDFTITSIDGKEIKLSDYRGKYLLLDFWASWCQPCRAENPNVVRTYNNFKNKNFTVLGISIDKDKAAWKQAIQADGLTWDHASDLNDFESKTAVLYHIQAIPASFIIDPSGKIVGKNLRGQELDAFLAKTLR